jgi:hypothetical protein
MSAVSNTQNRFTNLFFPQWQGSGTDTTLFFGAQQLKHHLNLPDLHKNKGYNP